MRWSRPSILLAGVLFSLLATGALRLAHLELAHHDDQTACDHACHSCPSAPPAPDRGNHPDAPADPAESPCITCMMLAVLTPDGLPVAACPFFPASRQQLVLLDDARPVTLAQFGAMPPRGPPICGS